jgi:hypothetical protein
MPIGTVKLWRADKAFIARDDGALVTNGRNGRQRAVDLQLLDDDSSLSG